MRAAFWLLALFGVAVAVALVAGNNQAVITLFWPPHRVDHVVQPGHAAAGGAVFAAAASGAARALTAVVYIAAGSPALARAAKRARDVFGSLLDSLAHQLAGRYIRATRSAQNALAQEKSLTQVADPQSGYEVGHHARHARSQLRSLAHLLVAESAQSLQNKPLREEHLQLRVAKLFARGNAFEVREGVQFQRRTLGAWTTAMPAAALDCAGPVAAGRGTPHAGAAHEAARHCASCGKRRRHWKPRACWPNTGRFSPEAGQSIVRGLALELLNDAHDPAQLQRAWESLDANEKAMPELVVHAASRLTALNGDADTGARSWLLQAWDRGDVNRARSIGDNLRVKMIMRSGIGPAARSIAAWLGRIESRPQHHRPSARCQSAVSGRHGLPEVASCGARRVSS